MLNPEMQRVVLLVALAASAYLLILAWNNDYVRQTPTPTAATEPSLGTPTQPSAAPDESLDLPVGSAAGPVKTEAPAESAAESGSRLIRVSTGSLDVWIDLLGGDIVRVELPRYPVSVDRPNDPYLLMDRRPGHVYIAESGLVVDGTAQRPLYTAARTRYDLPKGGSVVLTSQQDGVAIQKVLKFTANEYVVDVSFRVDNGTQEPLEINLRTLLQRDSNEIEGAPHHAMGPRPYLGAALTTDEERYYKLKFSELDKGPFDETVDGGWIAILQHYFISAWISDPKEKNHYFGRHGKDGTYLVGYVGPAQRVEPRSMATLSTRFYAGPKDQDRLAAIAPNLNLTVDYGFLWWLADPLFHLLEWLHGLVKNWGLSIILLTMMVKLVLFPLSAASYKSMANMRRVAPQMKRLQERYSDDRQKLSQEMMAFYKKEKINPLGGCLPMVLQMPVFLALYWVLFESVELRQAPFLFWIRDLSVMDPLFVLPILMGGSMFLTQTLNPPPPDPTQARVMKFMPVIFTVMFLFFPAGLVLYWLVNNLLSLAQQWFITRQIEGGAKPTGG